MPFPSVLARRCRMGRETWCRCGARGTRRGERIDTDGATAPAWTARGSQLKASLYIGVDDVEGEAAKKTIACVRVWL